MNTYLLNNSKWYNSNKSENFKLALCFLSVDGNSMSMPLTSISSYVKQELSYVETKLFIMYANQENEIYSSKGFASFLSKWEPDLIAVSIMSQQWKTLKDYLIEIKSMLPNTPLLVGGYQAIFEPDITTSHQSVDFLCNGDGEIPTVNLIQFLRGETNGPIQGMCEKLKDNTVFCTNSIQITDFSNLPLPDYSLYDHGGKFHITSLYDNDNKVHLPYMTGRGCPYQCTYCSNSSIFRRWKDKKQYIRKYPINKVINHIKYLKDKYNMEFIEFWDELFYNDLDYAYEFLEEYKKHIGLPFSSTSRVEIMSEDLCNKAAEAGCFLISFGLESGDEQYRKKMLNRKMSNEQILVAAENCKKAGIQRIIFNMVGMPFETKENMLNTLALNKKINPEYMHFFIWEPLPGTKLYDIAKENNLLLENIPNLHFETAKQTSEFKLNIKEHYVTNTEFKNICLQFESYQRKNNLC